MNSVQTNQQPMQIKSFFRLPSLQEVNKVLDKICSAYPCINLQVVFITLYQSLLNQQRQMGKFSQSKESSLNKLNLQNFKDFLNQISINSEELELNLIQSSFEKKATQIIAEYFCTQGFGLSYLPNKYINAYQHKLTKQRYSIIIEELLFPVIKQIEKILFEIYQMDGLLLNDYKLKHMVNLLKNYEKWMDQQAKQTFHKVIRFTYKIHNQSILPKKQQTIELYKKMMNKLQLRIQKQRQTIQKRIKDSKLQPVSKYLEVEEEQVKKSKWNDQIDKFFCELYIKDPQINNIKKMINRRYCKFQLQIDSTEVYEYTVPDVKKRLFKLLRMSIRKLLIYKQKFKKVRFPILDLHDSIIKQIMSSQSLLDSRTSLLQFYKTKNISWNDIYTCLEEIKSNLVTAYGQERLLNIDLKNKTYKFNEGKYQKIQIHRVQ